MVCDEKYANHIKGRLQERKERANESLAANEKSLRKYTTYAFPPLRKRWDYWYHTETQERHLSRSTTFSWITDLGEKWYPPNMMNYLLQPLYNIEEERYCQVIEVKVSNTTLLSDGTPMREMVRQDLDSIATELTKVPSVMDYATRILGWNVTNDLTHELKNSLLFTAIHDFLVTNDFKFPVDKVVKVRSRVLLHDLIMCVRYYPNRDDNRAYCKDLNKLRSLVGAALQRVILPKTWSARFDLHYVKEVCPAKDKDKLKVSVTRDLNYVHLVTIADISNFTGSASNAWLMLAVMALELAHNDRMPRKLENLFCCDGAHFTATVKELLVLYLYLTVGYPCTLEETSEVRFLPGGFLGVNANITVALLFYSLLLSWMLRNRDKTIIPYMKCQAGGDDVFILTKIKRDDIGSVKRWIRTNLNEYVGYVKELDSFVVEDHVDDVVVKSMMFCRSRVRVTERGRFLTVDTEPSVPLNEILTATEIPQSERAQQEMFDTTLSELRNFESMNPDYHRITDALLVLAAKKLPLARLERQVSHYYEDSSLSLQLVGRLWCSVKSVHIAMTVNPVFHYSNVYYGTVEEAIYYLLRRRRLMLQRIRYNGEITMAVMTEREGSRYRSQFKLRYSQIVVATADRGLVNYLEN